jgi:hypothetical protein
MDIYTQYIKIIIPAYLDKKKGLHYFFTKVEDNDLQSIMTF